MAQCTAQSKRSGERCRKYAIPGGRVCSIHGGKAPQVRQAAEVRTLLRQAYAAVGKARAERAKMLADD